MFVAVTAILLMTTSSWCVGSPAASKTTMEKRTFGAVEDGHGVDLYTLRNPSGMEVSITNYGGAVVSLKVPDRAGKLADVVLGYDDLQGYVTDTAYFGAIIGRYANRIAHGQFTLNGASFSVQKNDGGNALHGGIKGFNKRIWTAKEIS